MSAYTEKQARKMTCPTIHVCVNQADVLQRQAIPFYVHQLCQASDCIAWRSKFKHDSGKSYYRHGAGYCGLAGRP